MKRNPVIAGFLSLLVPGLGQIYAGKGNKGGAIIAAGFFVYASVEIFVMVFQVPPPYPMEILIPQILALIVAYFLVFYLWRIQKLFN